MKAMFGLHKNLGVRLAAMLLVVCLSGQSVFAQKSANVFFKESVSFKDIPVSFHKEPDLVLNLKVAHKIDLSISPALLERAKRIYE